MADWEIVKYGVGLVITGASIYFGGKWKKAKKLLKDTAELLTAISNAVEDDTITKEEIQRIIKEAEDIIADLKAFK